MTEDASVERRAVRIRDPEIPRDPWENAYLYISPGQHGPDYDLKSLGADGLDGGEEYNADIESWRVQ